MPSIVDPFDQPVSASGETLVDPFDEPEVDYSKLGEFDARKATQGQQWRLAFAYLTTPDEAARADIIRKVLPGSRIEVDPGTGRRVVHYQGEAGYIDKPGVTLNGILDSIAQVGKFLPAGKVAGLGGSLATRIALAAGASAATSVAEDAAAMAQGSEQGISPERAVATGLSAGVGQGAGELVVAPAVGWLSRKGSEVWRVLRGNPQAVQNGQLTGIGRAIAQQAGLDPDQVTPELAKQLEAAARQATAAGIPDEQLPTAIERQALSNRFKVPLTKGEITDDYAQQSLEENLRRMDVTTKAGQIMRGAEKEAATKLRGDTGESGFGLLRRELAPNAPTDIAEAGQSVLAGTQARAATQRDAYRAAYQSARQAGAALDARNYRRFLTSTEGALKDTVDYDPNLFPQTAKMLQNLRSRLMFMEESGRAAPRKIPLAKLENMRKLINAQWKDADATDRIGLDLLRNRFDEMVDGAIDGGRIVGDPKAVEAWKAGRSLYARFRTLYGSNPGAGKAEQYAGREIENWLKSQDVTGEEVIRKTVQNTGLTRRILEIHGQNSPAHEALKQGALEYVFRPAMKGEGISPRLVVSQYERWFEKGGKEQMRAIFSESDRKAIAEFVRLARAKIPQEGVVNFSNTGNVLVKGAQQLLQSLGLIGAATGHIETAAAIGAAGMVSRGVKAGQASKAVQGLAPRLKTAGSVAVAGGVADERASGQ